jgi:hypothetical protein
MLVHFPRSSNNLSEQTALHPQLTLVVVKHQQLARLTKPKETVGTRFLVIF